jgi:hypothetical protein
MQQLNLVFKVATAIAMVGWALTGTVVSTGVAGSLAVLYVYLLVGARRLDTERVGGDRAWIDCAWILHGCAASEKIAM